MKEFQQYNTLGSSIACSECYDQGGNVLFLTDRESSNVMRHRWLCPTCGAKTDPEAWARFVARKLLNK